MMIETYSNKALRFGAIRVLLFLLGLIMFLTLSGASSPIAASGNDVTIINLTNKPISVAVAEFSPSRSQAEDLTTVVSPWVRFRGWLIIDPGKSHHFDAGAWLYVKQGQQTIAYDNLNEIPGYVLHGILSDTDWLEYDQSGRTHISIKNEDVKMLVSRGYERVAFQKFTANRYQVTGNGYESESERQSFHFGSHNFQNHNQCWSVDGQVVDISISDQRMNDPSPSWTTHDDKVCLTVSTEGYQPHMSAARERGYYYGTVTIYYTTPKS